MPNKTSKTKRRKPSKFHPWKTGGIEFLKSRTDAYSAYQGEGILKRQIKKCKKDNRGQHLKEV